MKAVPPKSAGERSAKRINIRVTRLAQTHGIGTVGLCGSFARGEATSSSDIDLMVLALDDKTDAFGAALARATDRFVHLHLASGMPWHHPYHLCVRWLNCQRLPILLVPRGATILSHQSGNGTRTPLRVPMSAIPHFVEIDSMPPGNPRAATRIIVAPPLGGFLL